MTRFDIIVLGAGPAGSAAAFTAARAGLRVALVDKHVFPRDKLCGGAFTGRSMRYFQEIFGAHAPEAPMLTSSDVIFCAFGQEMGLYNNVPPIHLTMRTTLDVALLQAALAAGAVDLTGNAVLDIDPGKPAITLKSGVVSADLLIAADGVNSPTARALFGRAYDPNRIGFALEVEHPSDEAPDQPVRLDFGAAEWGYGWDFPKTCGRTIGVGGVLHRNADMKGALRRYLATLGVADDRPIKGQFLPFGNYRRVPGHGPVLLAGDAAGLVDPITGEGIAYALKSGQLAAKAAISAIAEGRPGVALMSYRRALRPIHQAIFQARLIRPLIFAPSFRQGFVRGFRGSSSLRRDYMHLLAGDMEYATITRKTVARLPRFALRGLMGRKRRDQTMAPPAP